MGDVVADAILWGTEAERWRADRLHERRRCPRGPAHGPEVRRGTGPVTFAEAFDIAPFGNLLNTLDLTGAQIEQVLEQQYQPIASRGSRPMLALGVSEGFTYEWDASQPQGSRVVNGSMMLNGQPIDLSATYRVGTLSFLAQGGDAFTAFTEGTNLLGGPEDLANLVATSRRRPHRSRQPGRWSRQAVPPARTGPHPQGAAPLLPARGVCRVVRLMQHRWVGARLASSRHTVSAMPTPPAATRRARPDPPRRHGRRPLRVAPRQVRP